MAKRRRKSWWGVIFGTVVLVLSAASFLPLVEGNAWWIRYLDFPRVQISIALIVAVALYALVAGWRGPGRLLLIALGVAALGYQAYRLHPYAPFMPAMAAAAPACEPEDRLSVLVINVRRGNRQADEVLAAVAAADPDLLLLMETNEWWDAQLVPLGEAYPIRSSTSPRRRPSSGCTCSPSCPCWSHASPSSSAPTRPPSPPA